MNNISLSLILMDGAETILFKNKDEKLEFLSANVEEGVPLLEVLVRECAKIGILIDFNEIEFLGCVDVNTHSHINLLFRCRHFEGSPILGGNNKYIDFIKRKFTLLYDFPSSLSPDTIRYLIMLRESRNFKIYTGDEELPDKITG
jgi:hypothetical protein